MRIPAILVGLALAMAASACGSGGGGTGSTVKTQPPTPSSRTARGFQGHVQRYGAAAGGVERAAIARTVRSFYLANAAIDGAKACAALTVSAQRSVVQSFGQSKKLKGKGCGPVFAAQLATVPPQFRRLNRTIVVTGIRIKGDRGYVTVKSNAMLPSELPLRREGGVWKLDSVSASPLR